MVRELEGSSLKMSEIVLDEELLEWIQPILSQVVVPSTIVAQLSAYLKQDEISKIRKIERDEGSARASRVMVDCLRALALRQAHSQKTGKQSTPIFTALLDILRSRGYETVDRLCRDPQEIIGWEYHKRLFDVFLPILSEKVIAEDFMVHLCAAKLFSPHTPEYELVMAKAKHEGNCVAMLEVLGQVWRRKENWSQLLISALSNYSQGFDDEELKDAIETMGKKIDADRKEVEDEEAGNSGTAAHGQVWNNNKMVFDSGQTDNGNEEDDDDLRSLDESVRSFRSITKGDGEKTNMADPEFDLEDYKNDLASNYMYVNNLNDNTNVKGVAPPAATNMLETDGVSEFSEERNSVYPDSATGHAPLGTSGIQDGRSLGMGCQKELKLWPYQQELAEPALEGKNVIIVAPTGSGKTIVAIKIALEHLEQGSFAGDHKIAFMVPTVALVSQQKKMFKEYLPSEYYVHDISGQGSTETKVPLLEQLTKVSVVVLTPQIFLNAPREDIHQLFRLFSMLIFDECHHTNKDHPYNQIMAFYLDIKLKNLRDNERPEIIRRRCNLPQIIGLTASVGVGKAKDERGVEKYIISLAANMDAQTIQTVVREIPSLLEHINTPAQGIHEVAGRKLDPFSQQVNSLMNEYEKRMKIMADTECPEMKDMMSVPSERSHQRYINWQDQVSQKAVQIYNQTVRRFYHRCLKYLVIFHNALVLNLDCRTQDALDYIEKELSCFKPEYFNENERALDALYQEYKVNLNGPNVHQPNPKLDRLAEILRRSSTHPDNRTVIFVRTRAMTEALANWMNSDPLLASLKPNYLTGSNANRRNLGLTQNEQDELLKAFKQGNHKVVIATSVGEEGLDIQKCNLVIRYEYVTNEIAMVQARGRGRAEDAQYILITDREAPRERINMIRESMMNKALLRLSNGEETFEQAVLEEQRKARVERKLKANERKKKDERNRHKKDIQLLLYCLTCDYYACSSGDIRKVEMAHHVVISRDFDNRIDFEPDPQPTQFGGGEVPFTKIGKIYCKNCHSDWGVKMMHRTSGMPVIKAASFVLEDSNQQRRKFKKWKDVPCKIAEMKGEDLENFALEEQEDSD